jgi:acetyl esterase/lipase
MEKKKNLTLSTLVLCSWGTVLYGQVVAPPAKQPTPLSSRDDFPQILQPMPLYLLKIPNSIAAPNAEETFLLAGMVRIRNVSVPTLTVYLPAKTKTAHSAVVLFPGGGYQLLAWEYDGTRTAQALVDHGGAVILVKYRMPSDATMQDKSIGPLQDGQQALRMAREHAVEWEIDPDKVGVMGLSAGGHLASTVGTHFNKAYIENPENVDLRPTFMVLVFPVITMRKELTHMGSRRALLGEDPNEGQVKLFSNEEQVTDQTPPTLLLHATDDTLVDVENSVLFYEALHRYKVPTEAIFFPSGNHGFFSMPRDEWMHPVYAWMVKNGWMKP